MQSPLTYIIISATVNFFGGVIIIKAGSVDFSGAPEMIQRWCSASNSGRSWKGTIAGMESACSDTYSSANPTV